MCSNVLSNSANYGIIPQSDFFDRSIANSDNTDTYYVIEGGDFVYNPRKSTAAPYGPINVYEGTEVGIISPLYLCFKVEWINKKYLYHYFKSNKWHPYMYINGDSGARHDRVSIKDDVFLDMPLFVPSQKEQLKITLLLDAIDKRIETQKKIIEDLKKLKDAIRAKLFRHIESTCSVYDEIRNMLDYEQPSEYLVNSTEYSDNYQTPVLTANKAFILGYTDETYGIYAKGDCIILDDFTMDVKYVTFPFKVKSSAIKILIAKQHVDLYFMYEYLLYLGLVSEEHKRHYISEIEPMNIVSPPLETQKHIALTLQTISRKIENATSFYGLLSKQKQYLLNQLFI